MTHSLIIQKIGSSEVNTRITWDILPIPVHRTVLLKGIFDEKPRQLLFEENENN